MPVMNGFDSAKKMREYEKVHNVIMDDGNSKRAIIIGVSANSEEQMSQLANSSGMNAFLTKPFRLNQLIEVYENFIKV